MNYTSTRNSSLRVTAQEAIVQGIRQWREQHPPLSR